MSALVFCPRFGIPCTCSYLIPVIAVTETQMPVTFPQPHEWNCLGVRVRHCSPLCRHASVYARVLFCCPFVLPAAICLTQTACLWAFCLWKVALKMDISISHNYGTYLYSCNFLLISRPPSQLTLLGQGIHLQVKSWVSYYKNIPH